MKVALLAGGRGSRLSEETDVRPKPMVDIGGKPILWHILMHYRGYGLDNFVIALGYKGNVIRRWVEELSPSDGYRASAAAGGRSTIALMETGLQTNTGGRIKRLGQYTRNERFMLAWGDGVSNVNLNDMAAFHASHGKVATMMVVRPPARFGRVTLEGDRVAQFEEKPQHSESWINGGVFILEPCVFDYIDGDDTAFERAPLESCARDGQLMAYRHHGFWQCMDTLHERQLLEDIWQGGDAPWKTWKDECEFWSPDIVVT